ncbi:GNAT family N-acetyltransferase [Xanthobacteraceae bacterium A53D]
MIAELQAFHHLPAQEAAAIRQQVADAGRLFEVIVAEGPAGGLAGFALASVYPGPGMAPGFYLKELFVTEAARNLGVGEALMRALARLAIARGYERIDWVTSRESAGAQRFYDRLGARPNPDKIFYRLEGSALEKLGR